MQCMRKEGSPIRALAGLAAAVITFGLLDTGLMTPADDSNTKPSTQAEDSEVKQFSEQIQSDAKEMGQGVKDTAEGIGRVVAAHAEKAGDRIKEASNATEPKARSAWENFRNGSNFGQSVR